MKIEVIFIGTTVAETSKKYGFTICSAGWSPTLSSFVRLYPIPWPIPESLRARRWEHYELSVLKNEHDNRQGSWKIDWRQPIRLIQSLKKEQVLQIISPYISDSIDGLNDTKQSLGMLRLKPQWLHIEGKANNETSEDEPVQLAMEMDLRVPVQRRHFLRWPYLSFWDKRGSHTIPLLDRGSYHLLAKPTKETGEPYTVKDLGHALSIQHEAREHFLFVGNMSHQRNVWLVISCISSLSAASPGMQQLSLIA